MTYKYDWIILRQERLTSFCLRTPTPPTTLHGLYDFSFFGELKKIPYTYSVWSIDHVYICVNVHDLYFFLFWPVFTSFLFSIQAFLWWVLLATCMFSFVYLLMPLLTNMWDPPLPFTPLLSTGQAGRPGLFVCLHSPCRWSIVTWNRPEIRQYETIFVCPLNVLGF